jgi:hypothetical protein
MNVFAWKETPLAQADLPALVYRDRTESRDPGCGIYDMKMPIEVEIHGTSPEQVRECLAELEESIFADETWGNLAMDTEIDTAEMVITQKENIFVASKIIVTVEYRTIRGDPRTQA